jgi:hypothetical protein
MAPAHPITDSPWFWAYLFGTAALIALALAGPKFSQRQTQIEREFQGRQRAAQNLNGQQPDVEMSSVGRTLITLRPLFLGLAAITTVAWIAFWRSRHWAGAGQQGRVSVSDGTALASGALASGGRQPPEPAPATDQAIPL